MTISARQKTPDVIVEVAESLWGERGLDGVSLREISQAAGLANPAAVQYHFGSKEALIWAIFASRLPSMDARRAALMADLRGDSVAGLLNCLFRPLFEQRNASGQHSYAAFLAQLLRQPEAAGLRERAMTLTPATATLLDRLRACEPALPQALASHRLITVNLLVLDVIAGKGGVSALAPESLYEDAISMAACALIAPRSAAP